MIYNINKDIKCLIIKEKLLYDFQILNLKKITVKRDPDGNYYFPLSPYIKEPSNE